MTIDPYRLDYPLTDQAVILDGGGYHGEFSIACEKKWGCDSSPGKGRVIAFEPNKDLCSLDSWLPFKGNLIPIALGARTEQRPLYIQGDSSSLHRALSGLPEQTVLVRDVSELFADLGLLNVDLLKLNIEGGEYEVISRLVETGTISRVRFLQVQFHQWGCVPFGTHVECRNRARGLLENTHREQWNVGDFVWESWERK